MIKRRLGKFVVMDKKGQKVLGTHDTKKEAIAQLQAVEINKAKGNK